MTLSRASVVATVFCRLLTFQRTLCGHPSGDCAKLLTDSMERSPQTVPASVGPRPSACPESAKLFVFFVEGEARKSQTSHQTKTEGAPCGHSLPEIVLQMTSGIPQPLNCRGKQSAPAVLVFTFKTSLCISTPEVCALQATGRTTWTCDTWDKRQLRHDI